MSIGQIKKKKKINKGFTLIELLSIILILAIVGGISIYFISDAINKSKEKTYKVTINNVEKAAESYVSEFRDNIFWVELDDNEYSFQCLEVQDLIDMGFFKNDLLSSEVAENRNVQSGDKIYIKIDKNTKVITQNSLIYDTDDDLNTICGNGEITGYITMSVPDGWAREKNVRILYKLSSNYEDSSKFKYNYLHSVDENTKLDNTGFGDSYSVVKNVVITENGYIEASIIDADDKVFKNVKKEISGIDREGPIIKSNYNGPNNTGRKVIVPINVTDLGVGVKDDTFTLDDLNISIGNTKVTTGTTLNIIDINNYSLEIINYDLSGELKISIDEDKIFDKLENGNDKTEILSGVIIYKTISVNYDPTGGIISKHTYNSPGEHILDVPYETTYQLEVWGAQGGTGMVNGKATKTGGYGGYSVGKITIPKNNTLYINVGGKGVDAEDKEEGSSGGYNGGGTGGNDKNYTTKGGNEPGAGGGGATHIATVSGQLSTLSANIDKILIVAGGGGGGAYGGTGGGGGGKSGYKGTSATPGAQTAGTKGNVFGLGGTGKIYDGGSGGGGGGLYGGLGGQASNSSGAGGSGYIGNPLLTDKVMYCYNCTAETKDTSSLTKVNGKFSDVPIAQTPKSGNGAAVLTRLKFTADLLQFETYGDTVTKPTREGYSFIGWNTKADGSGTMITKNTQLVSTEEHTLYAIWDEYPTCEITAIKNSTTVTAVPKDDNNALVYYGWSSSYSGENKTKKVINGTGTITYYVKDALGGTGSCSAKIKNTYDEPYCNSPYSLYAGQCRRQNGTKQTGSCRCCWGGGPCKNGTCNGKSCDCPGTSYEEGNSCGTEPIYEYGTTYYSKKCSSGYTKLSSSYCFQAK